MIQVHATFILSAHTYSLFTFHPLKRICVLCIILYYKYNDFKKCFLKIFPVLLYINNPTMIVCQCQKINTNKLNS